MNAYARFLILLPAVLPMLAVATALDYMLAPVARGLPVDVPRAIGDAAFKILNV